MGVQGGAADEDEAAERAMQGSFEQLGRKGWGGGGVPHTHTHTHPGRTHPPTHHPPPVQRLGQNFLRAFGGSKIFSDAFGTN